MGAVGYSGRPPRTGVKGTLYVRTGTQGGSSVGLPGTLAGGISALMPHQRAIPGESSVANLTAVLLDSVTCGLHMTPNVRLGLTLKEKAGVIWFSPEPGRELESLPTNRTFVFFFWCGRGGVFIVRAGFPLPLS